jgi:hypothetical protein
MENGERHAGGLAQGLMLIIISAVCLIADW